MPLISLKCLTLTAASIVVFFIFIISTDREEPETQNPKIIKLSNNSLPTNMGNRTVIRSDIAIVVMTNHTVDWATYEQAQGSLACYCKMFNYSLIQISLDAVPASIMNNCQQKDYFFRRHCVALHVYRENPQIKWFMWLGADVGIINPYHFIQEYLDDNYDITFYERGFNYDIMADSYIAKNTKFSLDFIQSWLEYDWKAPGDWPGYDNGPIHQVFVDKFAPNAKRNKACHELWKKSKDYWDEQKYVACARSIFNDTLTFNRARIIGKTSGRRWVRDGWFSGSLWSPNDFMFHGWKKHMFGAPAGDYGSTQNPMLPSASFPLEKCTFSQGGFDLWTKHYNTSMMSSNEKVFALLDAKAATVRKQYLDFIRTIKD